MGNEKSVSNGGVGFTGLLTVLFIGLKLTNYIAWSWFWVLSPTLIPLVIMLLVVTTLIVIDVIGRKK